MFRRSMVVCGFAAIVAIAACSDKQSAEQPGRRLVHGEFTVGDATLHYVATYQDTVLVSVEEEQSFGNDGQARARYEVVDGRLIYYRIEEQRRMMGENQRGFEDISLELEFDAAGRIRRQTKLVDGELVDLVGYEAPGVQRHFAELKRRADLAQGAALGGM